MYASGNQATAGLMLHVLVQGSNGKPQHIAKLDLPPLLRLYASGAYIIGVRYMSENCFDTIVTLQIS